MGGEGEGVGMGGVKQGVVTAVVVVERGRQGGGR